MKKINCKECIERMRSRVDGENQELLNIVLEDVPIKYQGRILKLLNPICTRCEKENEISYCLNESDYKIEFAEKSDTIIECSGFIERK